jgi:hypothetical protein
VPFSFQDGRTDATMFRNTKDLQGLTIRATNGEIGAVEQFYFDDETWAIRYPHGEHRRLA